MAVLHEEPSMGQVTFNGGKFKELQDADKAEMRKKSFLSEAEDAGWDSKTAIEKAAKMGVIQDPDVRAFLVNKQEAEKTGKDEASSASAEAIFSKYRPAGSAMQAPVTSEMTQAQPPTGVGAVAPGDVWSKEEKSTDVYNLPGQAAPPQGPMGPAGSQASYQDVLGAAPDRATAEKVASDPRMALYPKVQGLDAYKQTADALDLELKRAEIEHKRASTAAQNRSGRNGRMESLIPGMIDTQFKWQKQLDTDKKLIAALNKALTDGEKNGGALSPEQMKEIFGDTNYKGPSDHGSLLKALAEVEKEQGPHQVQAKEARAIVDKQKELEKSDYASAARAAKEDLSAQNEKQISDVLAAKDQAPPPADSLYPGLQPSNFVMQNSANIVPESEYVRRMTEYAKTNGVDQPTLDEAIKRFQSGSTTAAGRMGGTGPAPVEKTDEERIQFLRTNGVPESKMQQALAELKASENQ